MPSTRATAVSSASENTLSTVPALKRSSVSARGLLPFSVRHCSEPELLALVVVVVLVPAPELPELPELPARVARPELPEFPLSPEFPESLGEQ